METKHTPGPWSVSGNEIRKAEGIPMLLATVNNSEGAKLNAYNYEANAKLIAAAPDLLRELQKAMQIIEGEYPADQLNDYGYDKMQAAVKKATE